MKIYIVISAYNEEEKIPEVIESVLNYNPPIIMDLIVGPYLLGF